jgi:RimJ/RimL family protein N-acetyltransferase
MIMREFFLRTQRIGFSRWQADDLPLAMALWGDEAVTRFISASGRFTEAQITQRLETETQSQARFGVSYWPLFLLESQEFVGCCGVRPYQPDERVYELGFHLRSPYWGKGLATEAANAVIQYAFNTLNASALFAGHHPENLASAKALMKLGFRYSHDEFYPPTGLNHPSYFLRKEDRDAAPEA